MTNQNKITLGDLELTVREATISDAASLEQLMISTASWLKNRGSSQWSDILEGTDVHGLSDRVRDGEVFLVLDAKTIAAAFILRKTASDWDQNLWGRRSETSARYLHRLMIARPYAGQNLSQKILDWAHKETSKTDHTYLRLDCIADNAKLNALYQDAGFHKIGIVDGFCIYEK